MVLCEKRCFFQSILYDLAGVNVSPIVSIIEIKHNGDKHKSLQKRILKCAKDKFVSYIN